MKRIKTKGVSDSRQGYFHDNKKHGFVNANGDFVKTDAVRRNIYDVYIVRNGKEEYSQDIRAKNIKEAKERLLPDEKFKNETEEDFVKRLEKEKKDIRDKKIVFKKAPEKNYQEADHYDEYSIEK
jgi:hypothetical protein